MPYKMIEGVYINKLNDSYNNFPVYRREGNPDLGLYYHTDHKGDKFLEFGNNFGNGSLLKYGVAARLSSDPSSWLSSGTLDRRDVFRRLVDQWQFFIRLHTDDQSYYTYNVPSIASSPMIKAVCVDDDFRECNSDRLYLNERIDDKSGTILNDPTTDYFYRVEGLFRNLRPVYKHSAVSWYLQYVDSCWVVSESYRPSNALENVILRAKDFALRPEYITRAWLRWSDGWWGMPSLRVFCRGVNMSNICPSNPCHSNATCVYTSGNETLCLCTSGFTGTRCSVNKQCATSRPEASTELDFKYLEKRPGNLAVSFCRGPEEEVEQGDHENQSVHETKKQGFNRSRSVRVLFRIVSMHMYLSFYLWLIYLVGCEVSHCTMYGKVFYMLKIIAIVMICLSPAIVLLESFFCDELDYLKNIIENETASEYIQRMRGIPPKVNMVVECYHYETGTRCLPCKDASGNRTLCINSRRKIVTFVERDVFSFDSWVDVSKKEMLAVRKKAVTRFEMDSSVIFGDQQTVNAYDRKVAEMVQRNQHRDVFTEYSSTKDVPGLKKRISAYANLSVKPFWIRPLFFWIATLLQMTWPYRWLLRAKTDKSHYVLKKMLYKNTTLPREVDPNAALAGTASSVVESRGPGNTCPGNQVSAISDPGIDNPPYLRQDDQPLPACNLNAGIPLAPCLEVPHPNAPIPSYVAGINEPAPDSSAQ
ncbi:hypothetical protein ACROYT_G027208 [Oculina patagonica]